MCGQNRAGAGQRQYQHPGLTYEAFDPADALRLKERVEWHYTPKHGSSLNMDEIGVAQRQCQSRRIPEKTKVERELHHWSKTRNTS